VQREKDQIHQSSCTTSTAVSSPSLVVVVDLQPRSRSSPRIHLRLLESLSLQTRLQRDPDSRNANAPSFLTPSFSNSFSDLTNHLGRKTSGLGDEKERKREREREREKEREKGRRNPHRLSSRATGPSPASPSSTPGASRRTEATPHGSPPRVRVPEVSSGPRPMPSSYLWGRLHARG
jgi:hypothetical protein